MKPVLAENLLIPAIVSNVRRDGRGRKIVTFEDPSSIVPEHCDSTQTFEICHPRLTGEGAVNRFPLPGMVGAFLPTCQFEVYDEALVFPVEVAQHGEIVKGEESEADRFSAQESSTVSSAQNPLTPGTPAENFPATDGPSLPPTEDDLYYSALKNGTGLKLIPLAVVSEACAFCLARSFCAPYQAGQMMIGKTPAPLVPGPVVKAASGPDYTI